MYQNELKDVFWSVGVAVDGPNKTSTDSNNNSIRLFKKKGKVKALDEELYSEFMGF